MAALAEAETRPQIAFTDERQNPVEL